MERKPPTPLCNAFLVCRAIFQDRQTGDFILVAPSQQISSATFPVMTDLSIYARVTSLQGKYHLELRLQDLEGNVHWQDELGPPLELNNPLAVVQLDLRNRKIWFPKPGKFELVLLANGDEVFRGPFGATLPRQSPKRPA